MLYELASSYPAPLQSFPLLAPIEDRASWDSLPKTLTQALIRAGEDLLPVTWSELLAVEYLDFTRTGNRERYQEKLFARRTKLNTLILAECAEHQGRFLDDIINGIWLICEESAWQLPAHNSYIRDTPQLPLPDVTRPVVDLFSAETGAILAVARHLLKQELDRVSPHISARIEEELNQRIFTPYLNTHFWWMGDGKEAVNNWTVWCTQNVLLSAFLCDLPTKIRQEIFQKSCRSIDYFLDEYGEDGCCDEGAQYYRHAGLCLFGCLEILNGITDGYFQSVYAVPKIRNIAAYIRKVHVAGPYYVNFSDCSPVAGRCSAREYLFGKRVQDEKLMAFSAADCSIAEDPLLLEEHNLFYRLLQIFTWEEITRFQPLQKDCEDSQDISFPSVGLFIAKDHRYCLAVKAGDNDDSHNHNDTGSFTIYKDGQPLFADIGVETYSRKTFSPERYEIWTMQSGYHNLPSFQDADSPDSPMIQQHNGPQYRAKQVSHQFGETQSTVSMDIADAYPDQRIHSYTRTALLEKGKGITITDTADCTSLTPVLSLITYETPRWNQADSCLSLGELGTCSFSGAAEVTIERLPITDPRLQTAWKHDLWRTLVTFKTNQLTLHIR